MNTLQLIKLNQSDDKKKANRSQYRTYYMITTNMRIGLLYNGYFLSHMSRKGTECPLNRL